MERRVLLLSLFIACAIGLVQVATAEPYSGSFQVNRLAHTSGTTLWLDAATGANGDTAIMWPGGTGGNGVYMQRFDAAGRALQSQEWLVGAGTSAAVQRIAIAGNGNFALAVPLADGSGLGVFITIYDRAGNVVVPQFRVNDTTAGDQLVRSLAMNAAGQLVVTYVSSTSATGLPALYVKRYQANGAPVSSEITVYNSTASNDRIGS